MAKTDPSIRLAVEHLRPVIHPDVAKKLTERQDFVSHGPGGTERGTVRDGEFRIKSRTAEDGALIQSIKDARKSHSKILRKSGIGEIPIAKAQRKLDEAPENKKISLGHGLEVVKWSIERIEPDLSKSVLLNPLVPLKIAYEFLACHLGCAIYSDEPQMSDLRMALCCGADSHRSYLVERLNMPEYKPFPGIVFEGNQPYAKVSILLVGWLAFRVHFKYLAVEGHRFSYMHKLDSNTDDICIFECEENVP